MPQQEPSHITDNLPKQAWNHTTKKGPCSMTDPEEDLGDQNQQKDDEVDGVTANTGSVEDGFPGFRTGRCASKGTILLSHADRSLVVRVLKSIVDKSCSSDIPLGLEMFSHIVIVWGVRLTHFRMEEKCWMGCNEGAGCR